MLDTGLAIYGGIGLLILIVSLIFVEDFRRISTVNLAVGSVIVIVGWFPLCVFGMVTAVKTYFEGLRDE